MHLMGAEPEQFLNKHGVLIEGLVRKLFGMI
jgi:hypothetical protein